MSGVATTCQQNDGAAATSPIYDFETDIGFDINELNLFRRMGIWLAPQDCGGQRQSQNSELISTTHRQPSSTCAKEREIPALFSTIGSPPSASPRLTELFRLPGADVGLGLDPERISGYRA
jgi:hypothetical protein